ncbi:MAG: twin-arginine translocase subunit TatC [Blastocatellia bacterium]|nr:twin-arginine translocase subunit TatC [Blastocatellia bacterium]
MSTYTDTYDEKEAHTEEGSMSFLDHLDELRKRLMRSAAFVLVAFAVCWAFSDKIYNFLQVPVRAAMVKADKLARVSLGGAPVTSLSDLPDTTQVDFTFLTNGKIGTYLADGKLNEILIQAGTTIPVEVRRASDGFPDLVTFKPWVISGQVIKEGYTIPREMLSSSTVWQGTDDRLVVPTVQGAFNLYIKVSFYAAIFFAVPFLLVQTWGFVSPGLYPHEKKYAAPLIIMTTVFFLMGCAFAYWIAFPRAADFLLGVAAEGNLRPLVTADEYFDLIIVIMLGLGLVFEIPPVTLFLSRIGLVTPRMLLKLWRVAIVVIFIVAAFLSPTTDVPNLLVFAAPMLILYFLSIGIAWLFYRKRQTGER